MKIKSMAIMAVSLTALIGCDKQKKMERPTPTVIVTDVLEQDVVKEWVIVGQMVSDPQVDLRARVNGYLKEVDFKQGSLVKKGDLLFQIEKDEYDAKVSLAQANVSVEKALLKNAKIEFERKKLLISKNTISQAEFDKATADKESSLGALAGAEAKLKTAKIDLKHTEIIAPIDGRIGLAKFNKGNLVGPDSGVLATIVSLNPMQVEFNVSESVIVNASQTAIERKTTLDELLKKLEIKLILSNGSDYTETGKISFLDNKTNAATGSVLVRAEFQNPNHILSPGQYVKVRLQSPVGKASLTIPEVAIQSAMGGKFVMVVDKDNKVVSKPIKPGYQFGTRVVIDKGLSKGERVITQGIQRVRAGMIVKPKVDSPQN